MGSSENSKAYTIYIPSLGKTMVRRDVQVDDIRAFKNSYEPLPTMVKFEEK